MVTLICQQCGKTFEVHEYREEMAHFCKKACYNAYRKQKAYERVCKYCGERFMVTRETRNSQYCKPICRQKATRKHDHSDKICPQCGTVFPYSSRNPDQVFCKQLCALKSRAFAVNENFFDAIDDEAKAYALGLMYSDGCIYSSEGSKYLNFTSKNRELVELFKNLLSSEHTIYFNAGSFSVVIGNPTLHASLQHWGVKERKSWEEYGLPPLAPDLMRHFLRGFFDGDGCAFISKIQKGKYHYFCQSFHCASYQFLSEIKALLERQGIYAQSVNRDRDNFKLVISQQESAHKLVRFFYQDATYWLQRKYEVAERFYGGHIPDSL